MTVATAPRPDPIAAAPPEEVGRRRTRLLGVDATRGLALLGMMAVHSLMVVDPAGNATLTSDVAGGTSAATFAILAGVGVAFMTRRRRVRFWAEGTGTTALLVTRGLVVGLIGLLLGGVTDATYGAVILPYYALLFVLGVPLVFLSDRLLAGYVAAGAVLLPALDHVLLGVLPAPSGENPHLGDLVADPGATLAQLGLTGYYPAVIWTVYLGFGLLLGRQDLADRRVTSRLLVGGIAAAVVAKVVSLVLLTKYGGLDAITASAAATGMTPAKLHEALTVGPDGVTPPGTWWWLAVSTAHSSTPLDLLFTCGVTAALLGLMLKLDTVATPGLRSAITAVRTPLAAAGSLTLTLYTAHILFLNSDYDVYSPTTGYVVQVVMALGLGTFWWATAGRGPLEALTAAVAGTVSRWFGGPPPARPAAPVVRALPPGTTTGTAPSHPSSGDEL